MATSAPGALTAYGWSERVASLYSHQPAGRPGRVTRVERGTVAVIDGRGVEETYPSTGRPAVGDWVAVGEGQVLAALPRWSALNRQDPDSGAAQILAANVDVVLITVPGDRPSTTRAERELVLAWESGAQPVVVVTKTDLATPGVLDDLAARLVGVEVVAASTATGAGVARIADLLAPGRTGVLLGPSGAGKSTLTNALLGEDRQKIGPVRTDDRRGRHTTSTRYLLALPSGGVIIDTPGLRSLGLVSAGGVDRAFPDIDALASECRFADCAHDAEPGCAVTAAVAGGQVTAERVASYHELAREAAAGGWRPEPAERPVSGARRRRSR